jgi:hypothetical protein
MWDIDLDTLSFINSKFVGETVGVVAVGCCASVRWWDAALANAGGLLRQRTLGYPPP